MFKILSLYLLYYNLVNVKSFNLTLLHNNDLHSHFAPVNVWSSPCDNSSLINGKCFGGVARIIAKVREIRESQKSKALFLNAGDNFQGTVWYALYKWEVVAKFVKMLKYDAMTIGNHEFDDGVDGLAPFIDSISNDIPVISCNIDASNEPKLVNKFRKSVVLEVDKHKIGIIGYTTPETTFLSNPGKTLVFKDEIECIKKEVELLQKQGIQILIGLGHSGYAKDIEIAEKVPELDVIVGGHSHSFLYSGPKPSVEEVVDNYPVVVNHSTHISLVVQAFAFGKYLGKLDLEFDESGNINRYEGKPILLDQTIKEDPTVAQEVANYEQKIKSEYGKVIGKTNVLLEGDLKCRLRECNLGNLVTDAMVDYYMRRPRLHDGWTDTAIAVYVGGGIRATVDEQSNNGSITLESLLSVLPFGNDMIILEMPGKSIKLMLEHSVTKYDITERDPSGRFLQMSGLRVVYHLSQPEFERVSKVYVKCADCRVPHFKPLNETENYRLIVPKYIADGGDGYSVLTLNHTKRINSEDIDYQILLDYIKQKSPIAQALDNRIVVKVNNTLLWS